MGNCLVLQENVIKIMKVDGKIIEYRAPTKVEQVLSEFSNHAISDTLPVIQYLLPDTRLEEGKLYYLIPLPLKLPKVQKKEKKKVRFTIPEEEAEDKTGVVRVKLVISKNELLKMLQKKEVLVEEIISNCQSEHLNRNDTYHCHQDCSLCQKT